MITKFVRYLFLTVALACSSSQYVFAMEDDSSSSCEEKHTCQFCGNDYASPYNLNSHEECCKKNPRHRTCKFCGNSYSSLGNLTRHEKTCKKQPASDNTDADVSIHRKKSKGLTKSHKMKQQVDNRNKIATTALAIAMPSIHNNNPNIPAKLKWKLAFKTEERS